jgi:hypothetical protein
MIDERYIGEIASYEPMEGFGKYLSDRPNDLENKLRKDSGGQSAAIFSLARNGVQINT